MELQTVIYISIATIIIILLIWLITEFLRAAMSPNQGRLGCGCPPPKPKPKRRPQPCCEPGPIAPERNIPMYTLPGECKGAPCK